MRNSIRKILNQSQRRPLGASLQKDLKELLAHHGVTIVKDGRRFKIEEGDANTADLSGMLETDVKPLVEELVQHWPEKNRQEDPNQIG